MRPFGIRKSTFLRCLNRLEKADTGHIYIDGIDVLDPKTNINKLRAEVGMVFQSFNLFPHKTVFHNITLSPEVVRKGLTEDAKEKADFLLKKGGNSRQIRGRNPVAIIPRKSNSA